MKKNFDVCTETSTSGRHHCRRAGQDALVGTSASTRQRLPRKLDYAARDEANRKLGRAGEQWVIGYEQLRLTEQSHPELFQRLDPI
jgi:hypothetical protein